MTTPRLSYIFDDATPYNTDWGTAIPAAGFVTVDPGIDIAAAITAAGARLKTAADSNPCPVGSQFAPRKLTATFLDGQTFSIGVATRDALIATATAMLAIENVICVALKGERWGSVEEFFFPDDKAAPTAGTANTFATGKKFRHSGTIQYTNDRGTVVSHKVKVDTDGVDAEGDTNPPSILGGAWDTCAGVFQPRNPCPSKKGRDHRRFIGTYLFAPVGGGGDAANFYGKIEIPEAQGTDATVLACGNLISQNASIVCLAYRGEDDKVFQRRLDNAPA